MTNARLVELADWVENSREQWAEDHEMLAECFRSRAADVEHQKELKLAWDHAHGWETRATTAERGLSELVQSLKAFGCHEGSCPAITHHRSGLHWSNGDETWCDCGLAAGLASRRFQ